MQLQYSVAICPPDHVVEQVKELKLNLKSSIGWYGSVNSLAHITFDVMPLTDEKLEQCKEKLAAFAQAEKPLELGFNSFSFFRESRTVFIEPTERSRLATIAMFTRYVFYVKGLGTLRTCDPHMTIGRGLNPNQFKSAQEIFRRREVHLVFNCNNIALRRYSEEQKQYEIIERFVFGA